MLSGVDGVALKVVGCPVASAFTNLEVVDIVVVVVFSVRKLHVGANVRAIRRISVAATNLGFPAASLVTALAPLATRSPYHRRRLPLPLCFSPAACILGLDAQPRVQPAPPGVRGGASAALVISPRRCSHCTLSGKRTTKNTLPRPTHAAAVIERIPRPSRCKLAPPPARRRRRERCSPAALTVVAPSVLTAARLADASMPHQRAVPVRLRPARATQRRPLPPSSRTCTCGPRGKPSHGAPQGPSRLEAPKWRRSVSQTWTFIHHSARRSSAPISSILQAVKQALQRLAHHGGIHDCGCRFSVGRARCTDRPAATPAQLATHRHNAAAMLAGSDRSCCLRQTVVEGLQLHQHADQLLPPGGVLPFPPRRCHGVGGGCAAVKQHVSIPVKPRPPRGRSQERGATRGGG